MTLAAGKAVKIKEKVSIATLKPCQHICRILFAIQQGITAPYKGKYTRLQQPADQQIE